MHNMHKKRSVKIAVFGCGNILLGDDGFGPEVISELTSRHPLPPDVRVEDVGTGIREFLLDYLLAPDLAPLHLIIVDAVDFDGRCPGEVFCITPDVIPAKKIHDFSLHQFPTVNLLQELSVHTPSQVYIIAAQVKHIPDEIAPGLSLPMQNAVKEASQKVRQIISDVCKDDTCEVKMS